MAKRESNRLGSKSVTSVSPRHRYASLGHYVGDVQMGGDESPIVRGYDDALAARPNTGGGWGSRASGTNEKVTTVSWPKYRTLIYSGRADQDMDRWIEEQERDNPGYSYKSREKMDSLGYKGFSGYEWAVMFERMPVYTSVL